jgi:hypothetical protein
MGGMPCGVIGAVLLLFVSLSPGHVPLWIEVPTFVPDSESRVAPSEEPR